MNTLRDILDQFFRKEPKVQNAAIEPMKEKAPYNFQRKIFMGELIRQEGYDKAQDEGMTSGRMRYATINVSSLTEEKLTSLIDKLSDSYKDFCLCKEIQMTGFNNCDGRYIAISGQCHLGEEDKIKDSIKEGLSDILRDYGAEYVKEFIPVPHLLNR